MKILLSLGLSLICTLPLSAHASEQNDLLTKLRVCQIELSPLNRLDCYDAVLAKPAEQPTESQPVVLRGQSAQLALQQESTRAAHTIDFIVTKTEGDNPKIVITTPAIGAKPPRPILSFSCIDNITRMQVIFPNSPMTSQDGRVALKTNVEQFNATWFIRDDGYTLEASRGLPGIIDIKRILPANTLSFLSLNKRVNNIRFNISGLSDVIKPLRTACRW